MPTVVEGRRNLLEDFLHLALLGLGSQLRLIAPFPLGAAPAMDHFNDG